MGRLCCLHTQVPPTPAAPVSKSFEEPAAGTSSVPDGAGGQRTQTRREDVLLLELQDLQHALRQLESLCGWRMDSIMRTAASRCASDAQLQEALQAASQRSAALQRDVESTRAEVKSSIARAKQLEAEVSKRDGQIAALEKELAEERKRSGAAPTAEAAVAAPTGELTLSELQAMHEEQYEAFRTAANTPELNGRLPLHNAVASKDLQRTVLLLWYGADTKARLDEAGNTALHLAAAAGLTDICRALTLAGAALEAQDKEGETPLQRASKTRSLATVRCLLVAGASVFAADKVLDRPLHHAARRGSERMVRLLLTAGAPTFLTNFEGKTALDVATKGGHGAAYRLLESAFRSYLRGETAQ